MRNSWALLLLTLSLGGALFWGYSRNAEANRLALRAENEYQQAFHRLDYTVTNMEDTLARALATTTPSLQQRLLDDLRVYSASAVENMANLPLTNVKMERTQKFLNDTFLAADEFSNRIAKGQKLADPQWNQLKELHGQSAFLKKELQELGGLVMGGRIRLRDTERITAATATGDGVTPVLQGVAGIEQGLARPSAVEAGLTAPPGEQGAEAPQPEGKMRPKSDLGPRIDAQRAQQIAARFPDLPPSAGPTLTGRADGSLPVYLFSVTKSNNVPVTIAVTEQGGHVIEMLDGRPQGPPALNREQAIAQAKQFAAKNGLDNVVDLVYDEYGDEGSVAVVTLAPVENGLVIFHQRIKVRVARDNGEILGYDATDHWVNKRPRNLPKPRLSEAEAVKKLAPKLQPGQVLLGVTDTDWDGEQLAYRIEAGFDGHKFEVYINAQTGDEIKVLRTEAKA